MRASERMRARDELSEELLLMLLAMGLSGLTTVNEELDLAWGLSLAASHAKGLCGTYRSLILSETVTGVLNGCFCCCCCICFDVAVTVLYMRSTAFSTISFDSEIEAWR